MPSVLTPWPCRLVESTTAEWGRNAAQLERPLRMPGDVDVVQSTSKLETWVTTAVFKAVSGAR